MRLYVNPEHLNNAEVLEFVSAGLITEVAARRKKKRGPPVPDMDYQGERLAQVIDAYYLLASIVRNKAASPQDAEMLKKWSSTIRSLQIPTGMVLGYREMVDIADILIKNGGYDPSVKEKAALVGKELLTFEKQLHNTTAAQDYTLIVAFRHVGAYLRNIDSESKSAWNNVVNLSNVVKDINVKKKFVHSHDKTTSSKLGDELKAALKKLVNRDGYMLLWTEEQRLEEDPKKAGALSIYKKLRSEATSLWNNQAKSLLRSSGKQHVPAVEFEQQMKKAGVPWTRIPPGYTGHIGLTNDGKLALFTHFGEETEAPLNPGRPMTMNPDYTQGSSTYYVKAKDDKSNDKPNYKVGDRVLVKWDGGSRLWKATIKEKLGSSNVRVVFDSDKSYDDVPIADIRPIQSGGVNSYYTVGHKERRESSKDDLIRKCIDAMPHVLKRMESDIRGIDDNKKILDKEDVVILLVWMTWLTAARIGSLKNKNDGMSSLIMSNVTLNALTNSIIFKYSGKSDIAQRHVHKFKTPLEKKAFKQMQKLLLRKEKSDFVWSYGAGKKRVTEKAANEYLRSIGFPSTAHKIRHVRGTLEAKKILEEQGKKPRVSKTMSLAERQRVTEAWFKTEVAEQVAKTLGHAKATGEPIWNTSVKSYIDKGWMRDWFTGQGLKIPKWLVGKNVEG